MKKIALILFISFAQLIIFAAGNNASKKKIATAKTVTKTDTSTKPTNSNSIKTINKKMDTLKYVLITTDFGNIKIRLYDETPQHRDNFLKLVKEHLVRSCAPKAKIVPKVITLSQLSSSIDRKSVV